MSSEVTLSCYQKRGDISLHVGRPTFQTERITADDNNVELITSNFHISQILNAIT